MNLLLEPLFRVRLSEQTTRANLPELLALLGEDRVDSLPGLQRHQEDAFHIFLCYLAGAVLDRQGRAEPRQPAEFWLDGIRALTHAEGCDNDDAWTLVVDEPTRPAFLQPPASNRTVFTKDYKPKAATPDALDVLQTAKNHDVKAARGDRQEAEAWCYALLTLQSQIGFLGAGNQGIARMYGGFGSRPCVTWQQHRRPGARWLRDVSVLLTQRKTLLEEPYPYLPDGKVLLWIPAWDGQTSLALAALDPFFLEIARRIRLVAAGSGCQALAATASATRIAAKEQRGNLGDPWIPINSKTGGALTVPAAGLTPDLLRNLLFDDGGFSPAAMQAAPTGQGAGWFAAAVLVRGQGTTDGFHEAAIRVPEKARPVVFGKGAGRDRLAGLSKKGLETAATIQYKALRPALFALMEGGPESIHPDKTEISHWVDKAAASYSHDWSPHYFDWLWSTLDQPDDTAALKPWFEQLRTLAEATLEQAFARVPLRSGRNYRAKTRARGMFFGSLFKHFKEHMEAKP
ncbi:MAG: type I-E CRISPR-associated protein Cse1/CasA [Gallionellaceae bacterium]|nr:type I-E CRISPR-associated protein Cse1/CasA [Gallionellaceae bacterium]